MSCGLGSCCRPSVKFLSCKWLLTFGNFADRPPETSNLYCHPGKAGVLLLTLEPRENVALGVGAAAWRSVDLRGDRERPRYSTCRVRKILMACHSPSRTDGSMARSIPPCCDRRLAPALRPPKHNRQVETNPMLSFCQRIWIARRTRQTPPVGRRNSGSARRPSASAGRFRAYAAVSGDRRGPRADGAFGVGPSGR